MRHTFQPVTQSDGTVVAYRIGYYDPHAERWQFLLECENFADACAFSSFLNGGDRPSTPTPTLVLR